MNQTNVTASARAFHKVVRTRIGTRKPCVLRTCPIRNPEATHSSHLLRKAEAVRYIHPMTLPQQLAKHIRGIYFGGNWTDVNIKDALADVSLEQATSKFEGIHSILALTFHIGYFVSGTNDVLRGGPLEIRDKYSFDFPNLQTESEWQDFVAHTLSEGEAFAGLVEQLRPEQLLEDFTDPKYGTYQSNLLGTIEHNHYHLGQIVILKKVYALK